MEIEVLDVTLVALTMALTQIIKPLVKERYVPLIPIVVSLILTTLYSLSFQKQIGWNVVLESLKIAFAAMGIFKVAKTTVAGK